MDPEVTIEQITEMTVQFYGKQAERRIKKGTGDVFDHLLLVFSKANRAQRDKMIDALAETISGYDC